MILTCHLLAGAAIASKISNPFSALPLALLSHYFLDSLPQEEYSIENIKQGRWNKTFGELSKVFLDISFGILLISLFSNNNSVIFAAAFLAIAPDGITLLNKIFPKNKLFVQHQKFHKAVNDICDPGENKKIPKIWGILSQILISIIAIYFIMR